MMPHSYPPEPCLPDGVSNRGGFNPEEAFALPHHIGYAIRLHAEIGTHECGTAIRMNMNDGQGIFLHGVPVVPRLEVVSGRHG